MKSLKPSLRALFTLISLVFLTCHTSHALDINSTNDASFEIKLSADFKNRVLKPGEIQSVQSVGGMLDFYQSSNRLKVANIVPTFTITYTPNTYPDRTGFVRLTPSESATADGVVILSPQLGGLTALPVGGYMEFQPDESINVWAAFCEINSEGEAECGTPTQFSVVMPDEIVNTELISLLTPDYQEMRIKWPANRADSVTLYRITDGVAQEIYRGAENEFVDKEFGWSGKVGYRLEYCRTQICKVVDNVPVTVERVSSPLMLRRDYSTRDSIGSGLFIDSNLYFDEIKLYRTNPENYAQQHIATLDSGELYFYDSEASPGINYSYYARGCFRGVCYASANANGGTSNPGADREPQPISNLQVDTETLFNAAIITWDPQNDADGYLITYNYADRHQGRVMTGEILVEGNQDNYVLYYDQLWGRKLELMVQSFVSVNNVADNSYGNPERYLSAPGETISFLAFDTTPSSDLHVPAFSAEYGNDIVKFNIPSHTGLTFISVFARSEQQAEFEEIHRKRNEFFTDRDYHFYHEPDFSEETNIEYVVIWCSVEVDACVSSAPKSISLKKIAISEYSVEAPVIEWSDDGYVRVLPKISEPGAVSRLIVERKSETEAFEVIYEGAYTEHFQDNSDGLYENSMYTYRTSFCVYRDYRVGESNCSQPSGEQDIFIDSGSVAKPRNDSQPSIFASMSDEFKVEVRSGWINQRVLGDGINKVTYAELYKAKNKTRLEYVGRFELVDDELPQPFWTEDEISQGESFRYQLRYCNDSGCGVFSNTGTVYRPDEIEHNLLPPTIELAERPYGTNSVRLKVALNGPDIVERIEVLSGADVNDPFGSRSYAWWRLVEGEYKVNIGYQYDEMQYYRARACIQNECSNWSDVLSFTIPDFYESSNYVSVSDLYKSWIERLSTKDAIWAFAGQAVKPRYGIWDTLIGNIGFNLWIEPEKGGSVQSDIYFTHGGDTHCSSLYDQTLALIDGRTFSHEETLFSIVSTGTGCTDYADLAANSLYIVSDYFVQPAYLGNYSQLAENWTELNVNFKPDGKFEINLGTRISKQSDTAINHTLWQFARIAWSLNNGTAISALGASFDAPSNFDEELNPERTEIYSLTPELVIAKTLHTSSREDYTLHFGRGTHSIDYQYLAQQDLEYIDSIYNTVLLDEISEPSQWYYFVQKCIEETCGPVRKLLNFSSRNFSSLTAPDIRWGRDLQHAIETMTLRLETVYGQMQTIELFGRSEDEAEFALWSEIDVKQHFLELIESKQFDQWPNGDSDVFWDVSGLDDSKRYHVYYRACNELGCVESDTRSSLLVIPDTDGDGFIDSLDEFPENPNEWGDNDGDGVGDNADNDDDNDSIPDDVEIAIGMNPNNPWDAFDDLDNDSFSNALEYLLESAFDDANDTPDLNNSFTSFEYSSGEEVKIEGLSGGEVIDGLNDRVRIHGNQALSSSNQMNFSISGIVANDVLSFAASSHREFSLQMSIDGDVLSGELTNLGRIASQANLYQYKFEHGALELGREVTLQISFSLVGYSYDDFVIDAVLWPFEPEDIEQRTVADFDGDGKTDLVVRNPDNFLNYIKNIESQEINRVLFGKSKNDMPIEGDFDGDGVSDVAVRRPSTFMWYIKRSSDDVIERVKFGLQENDIPVPADYDGDGITDIAVRRPSNRMWYILQSSTGEIQRVKFGLQVEDIPVPADYDGDGIDDIAVRRPSTNMWYVKKSSDDEIIREKFGLNSNDIPVPADYDGDGVADFAVRRPSTYMWYIKQSTNDMIQRVSFGRNTNDIPVIGDYDGDGKADIAVRRPQSYFWYILNSSDNQITREEFGKSADYIPLLAPINEKLNMFYLDSSKTGSEAVEFDIDYDIYYGLDDEVYWLEVSEIH